MMMMKIIETKKKKESQKLKPPKKMRNDLQFYTLFCTQINYRGFTMMIYRPLQSTKYPPYIFITSIFIIIDTSLYCDDSKNNNLKHIDLLVIKQQYPLFLKQVVTSKQIKKIHHTNI